MAPEAPSVLAVEPETYVVRHERNQRETNEDSFLIANLLPSIAGEPVTLLAVADGMGGHPHGEDVSREALRKFGLVLYEKLVIERSVNHADMLAPLDTGDLSSALTSAVEETNNHVRRMARNNNWEKSGSTLVAAAIHGPRVLAVNLGDSVLFHYRAADRQLVRVTEDHTEAASLMRSGLITPEMARVHEGANRLEFYLGNRLLPAKEPLYYFSISSGDVLFLCSDGITGALPDDRLARLFQADPEFDLDGIAASLIAESLAAGETDNQTLILWRQQG